MAGEVADIERNEVIANLEAFAESPNAVPSQLVLTGASSTVSNVVGLGDSYQGALNTKATILITPTANSTWGGEFTSVPVIDAEDNARLVALYQFAWGWHRVGGKWTHDDSARWADLLANYPPAYVKGPSGGPLLCYADNHITNSQWPYADYNADLLKFSHGQLQKAALKAKQSTYQPATQAISAPPENPIQPTKEEIPQTTKALDSQSFQPISQPVAPPSMTIGNCEDISPFVYIISNDSQLQHAGNYYYSTSPRATKHMLAVVLASPFQQLQITSQAQGLETPWIWLFKKGDTPCSPEQGIAPNGFGSWVCYDKQKLDQFVGLVATATHNTQGGGGGAGGGSGGGSAGGGGGGGSSGGAGGKGRGR